MAAFPKFLAHFGSPILGAVFPTIDVGRDKAGFFAAGFEAVISGQLSHHAGEIGLDTLLAQFITFQTAATFWGGRVLDTGARMAEAQHRPISLGHVPDEAAVLIHVRA